MSKSDAQCRLSESEKVWYHHTAGNRGREMNAMQNQFYVDYVEKSLAKKLAPGVVYSDRELANVRNRALTAAHTMSVPWLLYPECPLMVRLGGSLLLYVILIISLPPRRSRHCSG